MGVSERPERGGKGSVPDTGGATTSGPCGNRPAMAHWILT